MYVIYTAALRAMLPCTYVQDVLYAGFAGAKSGHEKIQINPGTLRCWLPDIRLFSHSHIF
jgi:hypothetical protein